MKPTTEKDLKILKKKKYEETLFFFPGRPANPDQIHGPGANPKRLGNSARFMLCILI